MADDIYAKIRAAAQELLAEGVWPTVVEVRERLGTGSNTTINNTLKAWRKDFLARAAAANRRPEWPAALGAAFDAVWQQACQQAEDALADARREAFAERDALAEACKALEAEKDEEAQRVASLRLDLAATHQELAQAKTQAVLLSDELATLRTQLAALGAERDAAARRLADAQADAQARLAERDAQARAELTQARETAERREALAYERLEGLRIRLYEQVEDERRRMQEEKASAENALRQMRREHGRLSDEWRERLAEREREIGRLDGQLLAAQQAGGKARSEAETAHLSLAALQAAWQQLPERMTALADTQEGDVPAGAIAGLLEAAQQGLLTPKAGASGA